MDTDEIEAPTGSESLTIDQAAAAYSKAMAPKEVPTDQTTGADEQDESDTTTDDELQASDEGEGEETDGETGEGDETSDEDETETEDYDKGRFAADNARVKLGDEIIPISELKAGYLKNADATKKWQEAAEIRKTSETRSAALQASEEQLNQRMEYAASLVKSIIGTPPDPTLADPNSPNYDPAKYQAEEVRFRSWAQHLTYIETELERSKSERQTTTETESKGKIDKEWTAALEKMPELKDAKKLETFGQKTVKFGTEYGYTPQELANIHHDHRQLLVMRDAIKWRELQASKANVQKKVEGRPSVIRGGKRSTPGEHKARAVTDAIVTAQKSGRLEDVAAAYHASRKGT